jgi:transposase
VAHSYKPVDRHQQFLLPPDMGEWLPTDHLVWFLLEVVERIDTSELHEGHPLHGVGRRAYDPDMLLALLFYAYCTSQRSSRRIERLCESDVAYRVISGGNFPDHTTIARFRQSSDQAMKELFVEILRLCAEAGIVRVGVVAMDGTKMAASASKKANRTREDLERQVAEMMAEAKATDEAEDEAFGEGRGDDVPEQLRDPAARKAFIEDRLSRLRDEEDERRAKEEERAAEREQRRQQAVEKGQRPGGRKLRGTDLLADAEADLAQAEADFAERQARWREESAAAKAAGREGPRRPAPDRPRHRLRQRVKQLRADPPPKPAPPEPAKALRINTTDPDSRLMKGPHGWVQGYNAQAAVNGQGVILGAFVTNDHSDVGQFVPVLSEIGRNLDSVGLTEPLGTLLADAGYFSANNLAAKGPDRLISDTKGWKLRREAKKNGYVEGDPPDGSTLTESMHHKMRTKEGAELYKLRQSMIEPAFGDIKENRGFRRFMRRGTEACDAEWKLICGAKNLNRLFREQGQAAATS